MKLLILTVLVFALAATAWLFYLGRSSSQGQPPGRSGGQLMPCPGTPNCVCSETFSPPDNEHATAALALNTNVSTDNEAMDAIARVVEKLGGSIVNNDGSYIAATFRSGIFGFVDDVEFRLDKQNNVVQVRSASRVGKSDLGANEKRVQSIRAALKAER